MSKKQKTAVHNVSELTLNSSECISQTLEPGQKLVLPTQASVIDADLDAKGALTLTLANGSVITIENYSAMAAESKNVVMSSNGRAIDIDQILAAEPQLAKCEPGGKDALGMIMPAAGEEDIKVAIAELVPVAKKEGPVVAEAAPEENLGDIMPAAGGNTGGAGGGGFGFQSQFKSTDFNGLGLTPGLEGTSLNYSAPSIDLSGRNFAAGVINNPDAPLLTVNPVLTIGENGHAQMNFTATLTDTTEFLTVTMSGIPAGWTVDTAVSGGTYDAATGTWTITLPVGQNYTGGPILTPPLNDLTDLPNIIVTATSTVPGGGSAGVNDLTGVIVIDDNPGAPILNVTPTVTVQENEQATVHIDAQLTDVREHLTVVISGIDPAWGNNAAALGGTYDAATQTITIILPTGQNLSTDLKLTPILNSGADLTGISVSATSTTTDGFSTSVNAPSQVIVIDNPADAPILHSDATNSIPVDGHTGLNITAELQDVRETLTVTVTGIPSGWTVNPVDGTYDAANGTWTITMPKGQNYTGGGPVLTPPPGSEADLSGLDVKATSTAPNGSTASVHAPSEIIVIDNPANAPILHNDATNTISEGGNTSLHISAELTDPTETLTVTVTGIPSGWTVNPVDGTYDAVNGTWTITLPKGQNYTGGGPILTAPAGSDADLTGIDVKATSTAPNGSTASVHGPSEVIVIDDHPGVPVLTVDPSITINENQSATLDIHANLTDPRESLTVTVTNIGPGWTVDTSASGGTYNSATGTWTITLPTGQNFNGGPILTPPAGSDADLTGINVTATSTTVDNYKASVHAPTQVIVLDLPDAPTLTVDESQQIHEGVTTTLDIHANLTDPTETLTVTVTGIQPGWTVDTSTSGGTYNAATGTWTITLPAGQNYTAGGPLLTPPPGSDADLTGVHVTATSKSVDGGTASVDKPAEIIVLNVGDAPILNVDLSQTINEGQSTSLHVSAFLTDMTETLTVTMTGIAPGWTVDTSVSGGAYNAATGTWTITLPAGQHYTAGGPTLTPPPGSDADLTGIKTIASSSSIDHLTSSVTKPSEVIVLDNADAPILTVDASNTIDIDTPVSLHVGATLTDPTEALTLTVTGIQPGWTVDTSTSGGTYNPATGTWTITLPPGQNYTAGGPILTPPPGSDADLTGIKVTATSTAPNGTTASVDAPSQVIVTDHVVGPVNNADAPVLHVDSSNTIAVDTPVNLHVAAELTDPTEALTVTITGIQPGWTVDTSVSGGTYNPATGTWTITLPTGQNYTAGGPTLTPPAGSDADLTGIKVTATSTAPNGTHASVDLPSQVIVTDHVIPVNNADAPVLHVDASNTIAVDTPVNLHVTAELTDPTEALTVTITGIAPGWTVDTSVSGGTYNPATGTWTITLPTGQNYTAGGPTLTPPAGSDADLTGIHVTATSTAPNGTHASVDAPSQVIVTDIVYPINNADTPILHVDATNTIAVDTPVNLHLTASLTDPTEALTVKITGIQPGWTVDTSVSGGTYNAATGTWTITLPTGQNYTAGGPTLTPPHGSEADLTGLNVSATSSAPNGTTATVHAPSEVIVIDNPADAPVLHNDASSTIDVNGHANLHITAELTDHTETLTVTVTGIQPGWTVDTSTSGGTYNAATGTWTITMPAGQNYTGGGPILTPPAGSEADLTGIHVTATSTAPNGSTASVNAPSQVIVTDNPADAPILHSDNSTTIAVDGHANLHITAELTDHTETLTVTVTGIQPGWTVDTSTSGGTYNPATGTWTITMPAGQNYTGGGPTLTPPHGSEADLTGITVSATSTAPNGTNATVHAPSQVVVIDNNADAPILHNDASNTIDVNGHANLHITAELTDPTETLTVTVVGIPANWTVDTSVSGGTYNPATATWTITLPPGQNYTGGGPTLTPPPGSEADLPNITVSATSTAPNGTSATVQAPSQVIVTDNPADAPILHNDPSATISEGGHANLHISAELTDHSETLTVTVTGIQPGWTVDTSTSGGTYNPVTGTWTITLPPGQNYTGGGPILTPPAGSDADLTGINVTATSTSPNGSTASTHAPSQVIVIDDHPGVPLLTVDPSVTISENGHAPIHISAGLTDPRESLTVTMTGIGPGWTVDTSTSGGTYNPATGTWTITLPVGQNYNGAPILTPPLNSDVDLSGIKVTATSTTVDGYSTSVNAPSQVIVIDDHPGTPILTVDPSITISENEHAAIHIDAKLTDVREHLTVTMTGIQPGWTVDTSTSGGTYNPATGTWTITLPVGQNYNGAPVLTPPLNSDADLTGIKVTATSTTVDGYSASVNAPSQVIVIDDHPGLPILNVDPSVTIAENGHAAIHIDAQLTDVREHLTVTMTGIQPGWTVDTSTSGGTYNPATGTWTITLPVGQNYNGAPVLTPPLNSDADLTGIKVTATSTTVDGYSASVDAPSQVIVIDTPDPAHIPTVVILDGNQIVISEDGHATLHIEAKLTDASETLTVTMTGIAPGWTVDTSTSGGTYNAATGTWTITLPAGQNYTGGPTLTPPLNSDVDLGGLHVTATSTNPSGETAHATAHTSVLVDAVSDGSDVTVAPISTQFIDYTTHNAHTIALNIQAQVRDTDGSEKITKVVIDLNSVFTGGHGSYQSLASLGIVLNMGHEISPGVWQIDVNASNTNSLAGLALVLPDSSSMPVMHDAMYHNAQIQISVYTHDTPTDGEVNLGDNTSVDVRTVPFTFLFTPLVLDLDGNGIELVSKDAGVHFDMTNDGVKDATTWVKGSDGFLAIDLNGDGVINNQTELFGDNATAKDGFANLAQYDSNGDGVISSADALFSKLVVWQDLNQDGISQANEMRTLDQIGIASINLTSTTVNQANADGVVWLQGSYTYTNGTKGNISDVLFSVDDGAKTQGAVLKGTAHNDVIHGTEHDDVIYSQGGNDTLYGGHGADRFVLSDNGVQTIKDFSFAEGDKIDLGQAFQSLPSGGQLNNYVHVIQDNHNTIVQIDTTGDGQHFHTIAVLDGVSTTLEDLVSHGSVVYTPGANPDGHATGQTVNIADVLSTSDPLAAHFTAPEPTTIAAANAPTGALVYDPVNIDTDASKVPHTS